MRKNVIYVNFSFLVTLNVARDRPTDGALVKCWGIRHKPAFSVAITKGAAAGNFLPAGRSRLETVQIWLFRYFYLKNSAPRVFVLRR